MSKFIKTDSEADILLQYINYQNKTVIDVGCGAGSITRFLATQAEYVIGIDKPELIEKAVSTPVPGNVLFREGYAQKLPLEDGSADIMVFFASFHHVPVKEMQDAVDECYRVLKKDGLVCFIEPYAREGSYYDLTRLLEDEAAVQKAAYEMILEAAATRFVQLHESYYYLERSPEHFINQLGIFVADQNLRREIAGKAGAAAAEKRRKTGENVYHSLCRANILKKQV